MDYLYLRTPGADRRSSFKLYRRGKGTVAEPRLEAINQKLQDGTYTLAQAHAEAKKILQEWRNKEKPTTEACLAVNVELVSRYRAEYRTRTSDELSKRAALSAVNHVLSKLGNRSLASTSVEALQQLTNVQPAKSREKFVLFLNSLLAFAGRTDRVKKPYRPAPVVRYLTRPEFQKMLQKVPTAYRMPVIVAFVTGCRLSEVFALRELRRDGALWVSSQLSAQGRFVPHTKNKSARAAVPMAWGVGTLREWLRVSDEERVALRKKEWHSIVRDACKAAFTDRPDKHLVYHDLRHSYVIYWLDKGTPLNHVANSIGDAVKVMLKHYAGFVMSEEAVNLMRKAERQS